MKNMIRLACVLSVAALVGPLARADVVIVVSSKSAVTVLSKEQVKDLFLGAEREYPGGGVALVTMQKNGKARDEFFVKVLGMSDAQARAIWAKRIFTGKGNAPREVGIEQSKQLIADNPNAIGFIERDAVDGSVRTVLRP